MVWRFAPVAVTLVVSAAALALVSDLANAQSLRAATKLIPLASLVAAGFDIKAVTGNQSGVVGTLVLQKDKDVYLCDAKDLSIQPTAFECWPVK
jgi:chaperone required for assembly of F1-ATPase